MSQNVTLSIDVMGGDFGAEVTIPASLDALAAESKLSLILVGDEAIIRSHLKDAETRYKERLRILHTTQTVEMDDLPSKALRGKKDSSMRVAIDLVHAGEAQACISAGNTGALMATARFVLKTLPGIDRPAIISEMPSIEGESFVLDLGANIECTAEHLFQFAVMGAELVTALRGIKNPRVGLLNIGEEEIKGIEDVKQASVLLAQSNLNYIGYVEGDNICKGGADLIVTNGFAGNIALKSIEGAARLISHTLRRTFVSSFYSRLSALIAMPVLKKVKQEVDPGNYNGASFLGLRGVVIKSHGSADRKAYVNAILTGMREAEMDIPKRIRQRVEETLTNREVS